MQKAFFNLNIKISKLGPIKSCLENLNFKDLVYEDFA